MTRSPDHPIPYSALAVALDPCTKSSSCSRLCCVAENFKTVFGASQTKVATIQIDARELQLLLDLVKERIEHAEDAGIPEDHPSSVLRRSLFKKLMDAYLDAGGTMP